MHSVLQELAEETRKLIKAIIDRFEIFKKNSRSKSNISVVVSQVTDLNFVVSLDLESIGYKYILCMICAYTNLYKGVISKNKHHSKIMKALHESWCGVLTVGFLCDNGGEIQNMKMQEFFYQI